MDKAKVLLNQITDEILEREDLYKSKRDAFINKLSLYEKEKENKTMNFKKLENFIFLVKKNIKDYPNFKSFLWSLEARGICGEDYNAMDEEEFHELLKIVDMFLRLSYWG